MVIKKALFLLIAIMAGTCWSVPVWAWDSIGHMAVAYVAYQQLSPQQKTRVAILLKANTAYYSKWQSYVAPGTSPEDRDMYIFMMAATWPDEIKAMGSDYSQGNDTAPAGELSSLNVGYGDKRAHKYWHFVDTPFSTDGTALPSIPAPNAQQKIAVFRAAIGSAEPDSLKSYDLIWLMHLVGDVHQPLHCATRMSQATLETRRSGDAGGNSVIVNEAPKELHGFWDDVVGNGPTSDYIRALSVARSLPTPDSKMAADTDEADWVQESFSLAKTDVYIAPIGPGIGPYDLSDTYSAHAKQIAEERLALAGARLGNLIKANLK